jgi:predicted metal-dependent hydrolase
MSTNSYLQLGTVEALVVRKPIKNLHLSVLPPNGWVRISAPERMKDDAIRTLIALRLPWIKKQQARFAGQERQTRREYISGENCYFLGKRYRLEVVCKDDVPGVFLKGKNKIVLQVRPRSSVIKRQEVMFEWYRCELRKVIKNMMPKWQKNIGVQPNVLAIKRMRTRWGTCNTDNKKITLNLELIKKPINHIEYILVHELLHLVERRHNKIFYSMMNEYIPKWKSIRQELNKSILPYEEWGFITNKQKNIFGQEPCSDLRSV